MNLHKCPKCNREPTWDCAMTYGENEAGIVGKYVILMCRCTKMKALVPSVLGNSRASISRVSAVMKNMEKQWNALFPEKGMEDGTNEREKTVEQSYRRSE